MGTHSSVHKGGYFSRLGPESGIIAVNLLALETADLLAALLSENHTSLSICLAMAPPLTAIHKTCTARESHVLSLPGEQMLDLLRPSSTLSKDEKVGQEEGPFPTHLWPSG